MGDGDRGLLDGLCGCVLGHRLIGPDRGLISRGLEGDLRRRRQLGGHRGVDRNVHHWRPEGVGIGKRRGACDTGGADADQHPRGDGGAAKAQPR